VEGVSVEDKEMRAMFAAHAMQAMLPIDKYAVRDAFGDLTSNEDFDPSISLRTFCEAAWTIANCMMREQGTTNGL
jgi:hypothetical protein